MRQDSLVAINIVDIDNKLLNKSNAPLLYYWNGVSDIVEDLRNDDDFKKYCEILFISPDKYLDIFMSYFYFKYNDDGSENYQENTCQIQDIIYLNSFPSKHIVMHFLVEHFLNLSKISIKSDNNYNNIEDNAEETIVNIYNILKNKFKSRITKETVINWIRSVLIDTNHFNTVNTNYIISELEKILINVEE